MERPDFQFIALDNRASVIYDLCSKVSRNMDATGLRLPPAWGSVRELADHVWHVNDTQHVSISHLIALKNELAREDFRNSSIWREFLDEFQLISPFPLEQF